MSARGLSTTIGPRGASINIGQRGVYSNLGIPGTGLSSRQRLDIGSGGSGTRTTYRVTMKDLRERERAMALESASEAHAIAEARLAELRGLLTQRNSATYDWQSVWASRGDFEPAVFQTPAPTFSSSTSRERAASALPVFGWLAFYAICLATSVVFGGVGERVFAILFATTVIAWATLTLRIRTRLADIEFRNQTPEFESDVSALKAAHEKAQDVALAAWKESEKLIEKVRTAIERKDLQTLASVLEAELQDEHVPVPLVFELELVSTEEARIEAVLPELDDIPTETTSLTKRGLLSTKAMPQRDRTELYVDVCASVCLRLLYEAFRVVPSLLRIELFGTATGVNPATGHNREFIAIHLNTNRSAVNALNLDNVDPSSALTALGGNLSFDRRGVPIPLEGVTGIAD